MCGNRKKIFYDFLPLNATGCFGPATFEKPIVKRCVRKIVATYDKNVGSIPMST